MKRILFLSLVLLALTILSIRFGIMTYGYLFGEDERAGVKILSTPEGAEVLINDSIVGKTPFDNSDLKAGTQIIQVKTDEVSWQSKVDIKGGTRAIISRELSKISSSSAGEVLTLEKGSGVTLISGVSGADVEIDGKSVGKTPVWVGVSPGEHSFVISHVNYLKRSVRAQVQKGYNLIINVDLAISEADLSSIVTPPTSTVKVIVKSTPTGFLRVREKASGGSKEIARVKPKDELVLLEELSGWVRVRLSDGKEGFVASSYVEKVNP